jgi:NAD(P)-dependent dehydrogenase (short-subunit alcohol dehydrogenase family)
MGKLDGKVAVITGAASGISKATAIYMARQGAKVVAWDLGLDVEGKPLENNPVDETVAIIKEEGNEAIAFKGDVADMGDAEKAIGTAIDTYGKLDILCCIAGFLRERMVFNMSEEEWDSILRVHVKGTFAPSKFAAIHWRQKREFGSHIAFSSPAYLGGSGQSNYSAAKAANVGFVRSFAQGMVRYNVNSNAISPAAATRMNDRGLGVQEAVRRGEALPSVTGWDSGNSRDPFNIPPMITYLTSDEGHWVSGRTWAVEGFHYARFSEPEPVRHLYSDGMWDLDRLFRLFPDTLGEGVELPVGRTADSVAAQGATRLAADQNKDS